MSLRRDLENRFGLPFAELLSQYEAKGLNRREMADELGVDYHAFRRMVVRKAYLAKDLTDDQCREKIRAFARKGKSRIACWTELGIGRSRFRRLMKSMPLLVWKPLKKDGPTPFEKRQKSFLKAVEPMVEADMTRREAATSLGVSYEAMLKRLERYGDPFPVQSITARYHQETGGSLLASACYLAQTHTRAATARELGVSETALMQYLESRGLKLTFSRRERKEWRQHRATGQPRRASPTWQNYEAFGVRGSLRELTERFGKVPLTTVRNRVHERQWSIERALTAPIDQEQSRRGRSGR